MCSTNNDVGGLGDGAITPRVNQAARTTLSRLRGRVAGADDPQLVWHQQQSSDLSRVALMTRGGSGGIGGGSIGMSSMEGGAGEVRRIVK